MNKFLSAALVILALNNYAQNTIPTTTVSGCLKVTDTLNVTNAIQSAGRITSSGEMVAKDTMRAEKDVIVEGNVKVAGKISVSGDAEFGGRIFLNEPSTATGIVNPCLVQMLVSSGPDREMLSINPTIAAQLENDLSSTQCPQAPIIPFTWQTFGNHVNNNARWIGTIENFDFNIKTNNTFRMVVKANGDIGIGAYDGNSINTIGKKYRMFIKDNGDVGIGTMLNTNPNNYKLSVNGKIGCKEMKIEITSSTWSDFVFAENYKLMPLKEVEAYIVKNKHLPDVPSNADVDANNGIDVAKTQSVLLQKIEELTLYLIEQNKKIEKLESEILLLNNK